MTEPFDLAALRAMLLAARDAYPELRRAIGHVMPVLDERLGLPADTARADRQAAGQRLGAGIVGARAGHKRG